MLDDMVFKAANLYNVFIFRVMMLLVICFKIVLSNVESIFRKLEFFGFVTGKRFFNEFFGSAIKIVVKFRVLSKL